MASLPKCVVICGPTASGKSSLAESIADTLPIEIISADSAQVYRGMDIGTAKPDEATRKRIRHHLIDIRDPLEPYSAADFCTDVVPLVAEITGRGNLPVIAGGTMLYLKALKEGMADLPAADPAIRQAILDEAHERGWPAMHDELRSVDPAAAARIKPGDPQRLQRALEVYRITGSPLSELQEAAETRGAPLDLLEIAVMPPDRAILHQRIEARFIEMMQAGFVDEARRLYDRGDLDTSLPAVRAVGYRQAFQHFEGELSHDEMVEKAIIATRQLAKRQYTWLRSWQDLHVLEAPNTTEALKILNAASILG